MAQGPGTPAETSRFLPVPLIPRPRCDGISGHAKADYFKSESASRSVIRVAVRPKAANLRR